MVVYECKYCNIKTMNKRNYETHTKTKKHIKNEKLAVEKKINIDVVQKIETSTGVNNSAKKINPTPKNIEINLDITTKNGGVNSKKNSGANTVKCTGVCTGVKNKTHTPGNTNTSIDINAKNVGIYSKKNSGANTVKSTGVKSGAKNKTHTPINTNPSKDINTDYAFINNGEDSGANTVENTGANTGANIHTSNSVNTKINSEAISKNTIVINKKKLWCNDCNKHRNKHQC